jgi:hypothetical protein
VAPVGAAGEGAHCARRVGRRQATGSDGPGRACTLRSSDRERTGRVGDARCGRGAGGESDARHSGTGRCRFARHGHVDGVAGIARAGCALRRPSRAGAARPGDRPRLHSDAGGAVATVVAAAARLGRRGGGDRRRDRGGRPRRGDDAAGEPTRRGAAAV